MNECIGNYAEVRVNGKRRIIEVLKENDGRITGYRVNRDGSRWEQEDETAWRQELVVGLSDNVVRRLKLDLFYGELVEIKS